MELLAIEDSNSSVIFKLVFTELPKKTIKVLNPHSLYYLGGGGNVPVASIKYSIKILKLRHLSSYRYTMYIMYTLCTLSEMTIDVL